MHLLVGIDDINLSGTATTLCGTCLALLALGHTVTIAVFCEFRHSDPVLLDILRGAGAQILSMRHSGRRYDLWAFLCAVWNTRRELRRLRPDVVHAHSFLFEQALHFGFPLGRPVVATIHTDRPEWGSRKVQHRLRDWLTRRFYMLQTTRLIVVSDALWAHARKAVRVDGKTADIIWNGLDAVWFEPLAEDSVRDIEVIHVARADSNKNHMTTIYALSILARRGLRVKAVLAGDGPELERIRSAVHDFGLAEHVQCPGRTYDPRRLYRNSMIALAPSQYEGFDRALGEAASSGCAILASNIPAHCELLDNGRVGGLLPPDDPEIWANEIERLLADVETRQRAAQTARSWAEQRLSFNEYLVKHLALYAQLASFASGRRRRRRRWGWTRART